MKLLLTAILFSTVVALPVPTAPHTWAALNYSDALDNTPENLGNCGTGPVDAESTADAVCVGRDQSTCNVAFTEPGEFLQYNFTIQVADYFDLWVRVAANSTDEQIRLELFVPDEVEATSPVSETFDVINRGSQAFNDVVWEVRLLMEPGEYTLRVHFDTGGVNLCSAAVKRRYDRFLLYIPGNYTAIMYDDYIENSGGNFGNCPYTSSDEPYAQITSDPICNEARRETEFACSIGWTEAGQMVHYAFDLDGIHDMVDISLRVASNAAGKRVKVEVNGVERIYTAPGMGWQNYTTITWYNVSTGIGRYLPVSVDFVDGKVNLCSVGVEYVES